jgi:hypothetical protein
LLEEGLWVKLIKKAIKFVFKSTETYVEEEGNKEAESNTDKSKRDEY